MADRIANCQIGVFLVHATARGHTLLDRALYLPEIWTNDRVRCRAAGIPDEVGYVSKPNLAWQMLRRAVEQQVLFAWVTGDSINVVWTGLNEEVTSPQVDFYTGSLHAGYRQDAMFARRYAPPLVSVSALSIPPSVFAEEVPIFLPLITH